MQFCPHLGWPKLYPCDSIGLRLAAFLIGTRGLLKVVWAANHTAAFAPHLKPLGLQENIVCVRACLAASPSFSDERLFFR